VAGRRTPSLGHHLRRLDRWCNHAGPVAAEAAFQRNASLAEGEAVSRRLEENEADRRIVERQLRDVDEQLDRIESDRNASTAARTSAVEQGTAATAAPVAVPSLAVVLFWRFVEVATILGESINCATALLNASGADPSNLAVEWANGAAGVIAGCAVSALVISTLLFVITEWAFARIAFALDELQDPARGFRMLTATAAPSFRHHRCRRRCVPARTARSARDIACLRRRDNLQRCAAAAERARGTTHRAARPVAPSPR